MPASGAWVFALVAWFAYRRSRVRGQWARAQIV